MKDLVPDLTQFYKQYKSIKPFLQRDTKSADVSISQKIAVQSLTFELGQRVPTIASRAQEVGWPLRMHFVCLLLDLMPLILVEQ